MIVAQDLHKTFGAVTALSGVGFAARDGEITALIGPNGAGKTTTLRILCTVMKPDRGRAQVDGFDTVTQRRQVQRRIGVLPDNRGLYPRITAREHMRYFGRLHGLQGRSLEHRLDELTTALDMEDFIASRGATLSKGQAAKVALARALVHNPHNLLLDEPTNGLEVAGSRTVRALIRHMSDQGRCVLFSSHIMQEVEALADRLVIISRGRVVADASIGDLRAQTGQADLEEIFMAVTTAAAHEREPWAESA